ncbi:MAG: adenylate/guanylate cyclase domain-containing protein, partial [Treponema sp.]|nr:adenylate/guanylate cyclase domain-containing protein [Treponema sp.]
TEKKTPGRKSVWGLLYLLVPVGTLVILMVVFHIYVPIAATLLLSFITYIVELANSFITSEREKNTLRRGFASYVSPEVVSEIVKNPQLLGLGGVNKRITALFSDVRTFSGFTECINREEGEGHGAVRLVEILNGYLGALSDAIMAQKGTIDKYVGDEIVSFFGAPIDNPNNAFDSCIAAIRMKQVEDEFNREHEKELPIHPVTQTPYLLKSRVGLNTGDMVVGNMGTEQKLNYTVMGNNVNLASRLEGTNKAYDSWIIASESTWNEANSGENEGKLVAKMLDCVKVINVEKPVQIYSIQGLKGEISSAQVEGTALFNKGMEWYLKGRETPNGEKDLEDFIKAKHYFEEAWNCYHTEEVQDKSYITTEKKMIARCDAFLKDGLPKDANGIVLPWDGVYTMKSK